MRLSRPSRTQTGDEHLLAVGTLTLAELIAPSGCEVPHYHLLQLIGPRAGRYRLFPAWSAPERRAWASRTTDRVQPARPAALFDQRGGARVNVFHRRPSLRTTLCSRSIGLPRLCSPIPRRPFPRRTTRNCTAFDVGQQALGVLEGRFVRARVDSVREVRAVGLALVRLSRCGWKAPMLQGPLSISSGGPQVGMRSWHPWVARKCVVGLVNDAPACE